MTQQRINATPNFYKVASAIFLVASAFLLWSAFRWHDWFYAVFGVITLLNALMSMRKLRLMREAGH